MQLLLIRHGQANYAACDTRGMVGPARDFAPLSDAGRRQADKLAAELDVSDVDMILSSPYTRALETAAALCRHTGLPLRVEMDLHEWQPDTTYSGIPAVPSPVRRFLPLPRHPAGRVDVCLGEHPGHERARAARV